MAQITINNLTTQSSGFSDFWIPVCDNNGNTFKVKIKDLIAGSGASSASVAPIVKTGLVELVRGYNASATVNETNMFASSSVVSGTIANIPISKAAGSSTVTFGNINATVNGARAMLDVYNSTRGISKIVGSSISAIHITCATNSLKIEVYYYTGKNKRTDDLPHFLLNIYKAG